MLDTMREFGAERLATSGSETAVRGRLIARYVRLARHFSEHLLDDNQITMFQELRREHANVRAALECAFGEGPGQREQGPCDQRQWEQEGADLVTALHAYWNMSGTLAEAAHWLGTVIDRFASPSPQRALALSVRGMIAGQQGDIPSAIADIREGMRIAAELGDDLAVAHGYMYLTLALAFAGQHEEAAAAGAEAARRMGALGHRTGLICTQLQLAHLSQLSGDAERAVELCAAGLAMHAGQGKELWIRGHFHLVAGLALFRLPGKSAECAAELASAVRAAHELGDTLGIAYALEALGWLAARDGRHERAAWLLGAADPLWAPAGGRLSHTVILEECHQDAVRTVRAALGDKRYTTLTAWGTRRSLTAVIGHAIADADELLRGSDFGGEPLREHEIAGASGPGGGPGSFVSGSAPGGASGGGLTGREHEIAVHVASGLSNREIAARLFISKRTVDAHVEHIFGKLGISSRVQLTVWLRDRQQGDRQPGNRQPGDSQPDGHAGQALALRDA
jgi:non-specific serine/threonine protein kinase